jgi:hypothetical protein
VWDGLPEIKRAELIDGIVYVGSPVSLDHGNLRPDGGFGGISD